MRPLINSLSLGVALAFTNTAFSQQITPFVVSSSGGYLTSVAATLSFTAGELAITTISSPDVILTQGFQQPWDLGTYTVELPGPDLLYTVYPNPTSGVLYVFFESAQASRISLEIVDVYGRVIRKEHVEHSAGAFTQSVDLAFASPGNYFLRIGTKDDHGFTYGEHASEIQIIR